jgi:hypothetical protein
VMPDVILPLRGARQEGQVRMDDQEESTGAGDRCSGLEE